MSLTLRWVLQKLRIKPHCLYIHVDFKFLHLANLVFDFTQTYQFLKQRYVLLKHLIKSFTMWIPKMEYSSTVIWGIVTFSTFSKQRLNKYIRLLRDNSSISTLPNSKLRCWGWLIITQWVGFFLSNMFIDIIN